MRTSPFIRVVRNCLTSFRRVFNEKMAAAVQGEQRLKTPLLNSKFADFSAKSDKGALNNNVL